MSEPRPRILIVDNDPIVADSLAEYLPRCGLDASCVYSGPEALAALAEPARSSARPYDLVLCDVSMPEMDGIELLGRINDDHPDIAVIMLTGYGSIESAVQTLRLGASDYLTKPVVEDELRVAIERAMRQRALLAENRSLRARLGDGPPLEGVVGNDHRMRKTIQLIEAVAPSKTTVLMSGESGTGKSLIARAIHRLSPRAQGPFVELSCGSIPETLLESELFGHVRGAFTGAHADKRGKFLAAHEGTIFLDEINSASPGMQLKLLRVLQERRFEPVGSSETIEVDARVILASNQPLEQLVARGEFRQDLYYRINVVMIQLPPLRDRIADVPALAEFFLDTHARDLGKQIVGFSPDALDALRRYRYPGNVRELQNIVERAAVLSTSPTISVDDLPSNVIAGEAGLVADAMFHGTPTGNEEPSAPMPLADALREPEKRIILSALRANDWNRSRAAEQLDINRTTLYKKMRALGIDPEMHRDAG